MIYYLGELLSRVALGMQAGLWASLVRGCARLLQSYSLLIIIGLYVGFFLTRKLLPKFYNVLPHDRGRDFTLTKEAAQGKPTGSGVVFISIFVILTFLIVPVNLYQIGILLLTWLMMLTGFLDDRSEKGWGEYIKALLDLIICSLAAVLLAFFAKSSSPDGKIYWWLPFVKNSVCIPLWLFLVVTIVLLWVSINTTNCTDGVDGLSSTQVLLALITSASVLYLIMGHKEISAYLLVPHLESGASWGARTFCLSGVLMGYLWHNAYPSHVLMGDAGSRALGFFIGITVMLTGNPFMFLATSSIIFINGGLGLIKVFLKRFFHISIFENVRFPLHDHMRKKRGWSPTQVLLKFLILQILIAILMLGIFFKLR